MDALRLISVVLLLFQVLLPPLAAQENQPSRVWLLRDGSSMEGIFVRLMVDKLIIRKQVSGQAVEVPIPLDWLVPRSLEVAEAIQNGVSDKIINTVMMMEFTKIGGGTFQMGAPKDLPARQDVEPFHHVKLTQSYSIKQTEVTWAEWNAVRTLAQERGYTDLAEGRNGYHGDESGLHPVTEVSWWDAVKWCNAKSQIEGKTPAYHISADFSVKTILKTGSPPIHWKLDANGYRLPTEAEWEHAWHRRGRIKGKAEYVGWHCGNSNLNTHPVNSVPNTGYDSIHDLIGNVAEWCWDWKGPLTAFGHETDPRGPESGPHRVFRGGSFADHPWCCMPSYRGDFSPVAPRSCFVGFRPVYNTNR